MNVDIIVGDIMHEDGDTKDGDTQDEELKYIDTENGDTEDARTKEGDPIHGMGWLRLVGSSKLQVSFAEEPYKRDDILQKSPRFLRTC